MKAKLVAASLTTLAILVIATLLAAGSSPPSIAGTYRLVSRDLPDGTTVTPPELGGLITYAGEYRNFNIFWRTPEGEIVSIGQISRYALTEDEYTETNVYRWVNDPATGEGPSYEFEAVSGSSTVTVADGRVEFDLPLFGEPHVVYEPDRLTASIEGEFVDHWEKVD